MFVACWDCSFLKRYSPVAGSRLSQMGFELAAPGTRKERQNIFWDSDMIILFFDFCLPFGKRPRLWAGLGEYPLPGPVLD